jgi:GNAT superfamily N-acetyltransferase
MMDYQLRTNKMVLNAVLLAIAGVFLASGVICQQSISNKDIGCIYKLNSTLRIPMAFGKNEGQESLRRPAELAAESFNQNYEILMLEPCQYAEYANIFKGIHKQEIEDTNAYRESHPAEKITNRAVGIFESMAENLERAARYPDVPNFLNFWVAKNSNGEIVGARCLNRGRYIKKIGKIAVTGEDAVRLQYRQKGAGKLLRNTAFDWMVDNRYYLYAGLMEDDNEKSIKNFYSVAKQRGLSVEKAPESFNMALKFWHFYLIKLEENYVSNTTMAKDDVLTNRHQLNECL